MSDHFRERHQADGRGFGLTVPAEILRPLVQEIVVEVLGALQADQQRLGHKLAYPEAEAAALLGLQPHQLRDERLRGRVEASTGPGGKILYQHTDLLAYLASRRWAKNKE